MRAKQGLFTAGLVFVRLSTGARKHQKFAPRDAFDVTSAALFRGPCPVPSSRFRLRSGPILELRPGRKRAGSAAPQSGAPETGLVAESAPGG